MSYEIIYDKQFIKVKENLFVPMVFSGSNNCTEWGNGKTRRARNWFVLNVGESVFLSKEEMIKHCEEERIRIKNNYPDGDYSDETFGSWSGLAIGNTRNKVTYGMYKGIFTTGCRKALTVEQLVTQGISVTVSSYSYKDGYHDLDSTNITVKTSDELLHVYNKAKLYYQDVSVSVYISLGYNAEYQVPKARKHFFPTKKNKSADIDIYDDFWTVKVDDRYFAKKLKHGYRWNYEPYLKYATEKAAIKKAKSYKNIILEVEFVKSKHKRPKELV